jgi:hypothetical protein
MDVCCCRVLELALPEHPHVGISGSRLSGAVWVARWDAPWIAVCAAGAARSGAHRRRDDRRRAGVDDHARVLVVEAIVAVDDPQVAPVP